MQISHNTQTSHYKDDLYDLDIELKIANPSINSENANLDDTLGLCTPGCQTN